MRGLANDHVISGPMRGLEIVLMGRGQHTYFLHFFALFVTFVHFLSLFFLQFPPPSPPLYSTFWHLLAHFGTLQHLFFWGGGWKVGLLSSPPRLVQITDCPRHSNQANCILTLLNYVQPWQPAVTAILVHKTRKQGLLVPKIRFC